MSAAHGDPPAVARQRVRRALRRFREGTPWSQGEVAKKLGWSLSKMQRIETGEVGVSATDLRALLDLYGVTDPAEVERLALDAHASRRQRYVTPPTHREHLTAGLLKLIQFEREARSIRTYQPVSFPGVLQTPAVAAAIMQFWRGSLEDEVLQVRLEVRMSRREHVFGSAGGPEYFLILDESVIKRPIGDYEITAEQLEDIVRLARSPQVHIRLVPLDKGAYMPGFGAFQLLELGSGDDETVLYRESYLSDEIIHDANQVKIHRAAFEELWEKTLSEEASLSAIVAQAAYLRAHIDRLPREMTT
jgi:transcriptional regulator with XRE-family HTH domain